MLILPLKNKQASYTFHFTLLLTEQTPFIKKSIGKFSLQYSYKASAMIPLTEKTSGLGLTGLNKKGFFVIQLIFQDVTTKL